MCHIWHSKREEVRKHMMKRTISGMIGAGSLAHNRRDFVAENVDPDRVQLNICYKNENLKEVYKELFDDAVERYNVGKRKDRQIANYYEKIRQGKQEKLFHEVIFQIGNREDMAVGTSEGNLAVKVLDEYVKDFQKRNPTLRVFSCYLHQDEATPHLHIDFVPYVTNWKGKGMNTKVSLKQALKSLGFQGGNKHDTELNQWINHQPVIYSDSNKFDNNIGLFRVDKSFYTPDFILKKEKNGETTYCILDAKWRNRNALLKKENEGGLRDLVYKYSYSVVDKYSRHCIDNLWLLQGKDDSTNSNWYIHRRSPISKQKGEKFQMASGIVKYTPQTGSLGLRRVVNSFLSE